VGVLTHGIPPRRSAGHATPAIRAQRSHKRDCSLSRTLFAIMAGKGQAMGSVDDPSRQDAVRLPIWMRPERGARGRRPAHSRSDIAAAAIRIADAEGIEAVSLRRVAGELGTGTTSLYRYI